jgi:hypothetical protein
MDGGGIMTRMRSVVLPTLPSSPALGKGGDERLALLAGLSFVEGATSGWGQEDLTGWFRAHATALGRESPPVSVTDATMGAIALQPGVKLTCDKHARVDDLPKLLSMSRWRVILTLRGLLTKPCDDRFLQAAIFAGRVARTGGAWRAGPRDTDSLSDVVLSLFAVDVLGHRDFYEQSLCVCDVCGRVSFSPEATTRGGCGDHVPETDTPTARDLQSRRLLARRPRARV